MSKRGNVVSFKDMSAVLTGAAKARSERSKAELEDFLKKNSKQTVKKHENDIFLTKEILLTPNEMTVDLSYQRDPARMPIAKKIIEEGFNLNRAEPLHVHVRKNKEVAILDGGGRWHIMKNLLGMGDTQVKCLNHPCIKSVEEETIVYLKLNTPNRAKVTEVQKYKARLLLGDEEAVEIENNCVKGGLSVLGNGRNRIPLAAAEVLNHFGNLRRIGVLKNEAWPEFKIDSWVFIALGAIIKACPDIKERELIKTLVAKPPLKLYSKVYQRIGFGTPHSRNMPPMMAQIILDEYNKGRTTNKVTPEWSRVDELCTEHPYNDRWGWHMRGEKSPAGNPNGK